MHGVLQLSQALRPHARRLLANSCQVAHLRHVTSGSSSQPDGLLVVPFPKLSHTMECGRLVKWHKKPGDRVEMYDVLFEVATDQLTEDVFKVGNFAGTVHLLVEAQEEGYLAQVWTPADDKTDIKVGTPVGLICEEESDMSGAAKTYQCLTNNIYDQKQPTVPVLTWQSFLKHGTSDIKCMG